MSINKDKVKRVTKASIKTILIIMLTLGSIKGCSYLVDLNNENQKNYESKYSEGAFAELLSDDMNKKLVEAGLESGYVNASFRGIISNYNNNSVLDEEIYFVVQKDDTPYIVKATIQSDDKDISHYRNQIGKKEDIIDNFDKLDVYYEIAPTSLEILNTLDKLSESGISSINKPQYDFQELLKSTIYGYSIEPQDDGSFMVTITSVLESKRRNDAWFVADDKFYNNKDASFIVSGVSTDQELVDAIYKHISKGMPCEYEVFSEAQHTTHSAFTKPKAYKMLPEKTEEREMQ